MPASSPGEVWDAIWEEGVWADGVWGSPVGNVVFLSSEIVISDAVRASLLRPDDSRSSSNIIIIILKS